jgi:zona occludens toxin (predicted ATPase)
VARLRGKKSLTLIIAILVVGLVIVGGYFFAKGASTPVTVSTTSTSNQAAQASTSSTDTVAASTSSSSSAPAVDPTTLDTIDVQPLGITVSYTKGTPGFAFDIQKTADQTQYVEFTSTNLVGTKCTDDQGLFATIIKNPSSTEDQATLTATTKVGSDTYGLSLASDDCTGNAALLTTYQTGFKNGFSSLKALAQ